MPRPAAPPPDLWPHNHPSPSRQPSTSPYRHPLSSPHHSNTSDSRVLPAALPSARHLQGLVESPRQAIRLCNRLRPPALATPLALCGASTCCRVATGASNSPHTPLQPTPPASTSAPMRVLGAPVTPPPPPAARRTAPSRCTSNDRIHWSFCRSGGCGSGGRCRRPRWATKPR